MYSSRKVSLVGILIAASLNYYVRSNQFREIVHNEASKDFLVDVLHLFCVKMQKTDSVFERTE